MSSGLSTMEDFSLVDERPRKPDINTRRIVIFAGVFVIVATILATILVLALRDVDSKHKNLIIMIGDGFGPAAVTLGRTCKGEDLYLEAHQTGMIRTRSEESLVTDSAAGATTYACGLRTYNKAIAVDMNVKPCGTIFEAARAKGMAIGAVVTSRVTHATPAAFTAHAYDRDDEEFIATQQLDQGLTVLMGGGREFFDDRSDNVDVIQKFKDKGYHVLLSKSEFDGYKGDGPVLGLFSDSHMAYEVDRSRDNKQPSLADMTSKAIDILKKKGGDKGFMLLVEGSRIDMGGHDNDPVAQLGDILAFDQAAKVVLDFAEKEKNTMVVATADHETGGLSLGAQLDYTIYPNYTWYPEIIIRANASAEFLSSLIRNGSDIEEVMKKYSLPDISSDEVAFIQSRATNPTYLLYAIGKVIADRALIGYTTHGHTGVDVDLFVYSPFKDKVPVGQVVNSDLGKYLAKEFGLEIEQLEITKKLSNFNPRPSLQSRKRYNHLDHGR